MNRVSAAIGRKLAASVRTKGLRIRPERGIVSFTFDDAPRSSLTNGARLLEAAGACGTYYVAGDLVDGESEGRPYLTRDDLAWLNERGHELACHTFSHARVPEMDAATLGAELDRNQTFVADACGDTRLTSFAYPFGDVSPARKLQAQARFASCRGITPGVNRGVADLGLLKAVALYGRSRDDAALRGWLEETERCRGWLILYTHDVDDEPTEWGASVDQLEAAIGDCMTRGFEILTVRNALGRLAFS
ncbi:MAG: polysaccharide deacetylase family protein [Caulobacteraceae bacterium]